MKVKHNKMMIWAGLLLLMQGCSLRTDLDQLQDWDPELAAPLIYGEATLGDIVGLFDSLAWLRTEPDGQFFLHYETELVELGSADLFDIQDFTETYDTTKTGTTFPLFSLDKGIVGAGAINYEASYSGTDPVEMVVDFDQIYEPGGVVPFQFRDTFNGPGMYTGSISLEGIEIIPNQQIIRGEYTLATLSDGTRTVLDSLKIIFKDLRLHFAQGYFPSYDFELDSGLLATNLTLPDGFPFPILTNPAIELRINNEFGVPNELQATRLRFSYPNGPDIDLIDDRITQGFPLNYPTTPGDSAQTIIRLDRSNSNLDRLIAAIPDSIEYGGILSLFPDSVPVQGFVIDTANVTVNLIADFPLEFRAEPWEWEQWFAWDSLGWDRGGQVEFRLETSNGLPVEVMLELFTAGADSSAVTPFFTQPLSIQAPTLDVNGAAEAPAEEIRFLSVSDGLLEELTRTGLIYARLRLATPMNGTRAIQLFAQDRFSFKLGVRYRQ